MRPICDRNVHKGVMSNIHQDILHSINQARERTSQTFLSVATFSPRFVLDRAHAAFILSFLRATPRIHRLSLNCNVRLETELSALDVLRDYFLSRDNENNSSGASIHLTTIRVFGDLGPLVHPPMSEGHDDGSLLKSLVLMLPTNNDPTCILEEINFHNIDFTIPENRQSLRALLRKQTFWKKINFSFCKFSLHDTARWVDGLNFQTSAAGSLIALEVELCHFAPVAESSATLTTQRQAAKNELFRFLTTAPCKLQVIRILQNGEWLLERLEEHVLNVLKHTNMSLLQVTGVDNEEYEPYLRRNAMISHARSSLETAGRGSLSSIWALGLARLSVRACDLTAAWMVLKALAPTLVEDRSSLLPVIRKPGLL